MDDMEELDRDDAPVLVIGGSGYLGLHLVLALLHSPKYSSISVLSRTFRGNRHAGALYYAGDFTKENDVRSLLARILPRVIFYTACLSPGANKKTQHATNIFGTEVLVKCAAESPFVQDLVYASCHEAIEIGPNNDILTDETAKFDIKKSNTTPFQKSKAIAEHFMLTSNPWTLRALCLQLPLIYGGGYSLVIPELLEIMKQGNAHSKSDPKRKSSSTSKSTMPCTRVDGESFFIIDDNPTPWYDFARNVWYIASDRTARQSIRVVPMNLALASASVNIWVSSALTLGRKKPEVTSDDIARLGRGFGSRLRRRGRCWGMSRWSRWRGGLRGRWRACWKVLVRIDLF